MKTLKWMYLLAVIVTGGCSDSIKIDLSGLNFEPDQVFVANTEGHNVVRYASVTGVFRGVFIQPKSGGLFAPGSMTLGADADGDGERDFYISSGDRPGVLGGERGSAILRYSGVSGAFLDALVIDDPSTADLDETGGLHRPFGFEFGPDGMLYVASFLSDQILRYDGETGVFIDVFASGNAQPGGVNGPSGLLFGPDGALYVTTQGSVAVEGEPDFSLGLPSQVLRFDVSTRSSVVFASPEPAAESGGVVRLSDLKINPTNGDLYVSDFAGGVLRYELGSATLVDRISTNYTGTQPSNNFVGGLAFGGNDDLFVTGFDHRDGANNVGAILKFNPETGSSIGPEPFIGPDSRLARPMSVLFKEARVGE